VNLGQNKDLMPIFTKESLEALRNKIDLVDLLSVHMELKKSGASYKGLCPFHDEKSPSFMIQKGDTHYHCFGCGAHGDAIQFLMAHLKLSFSDAVENLAGRYHVHLEQVEGQQEQKGPAKSLLREALEHAWRFYHYYLLHTHEGHQALQYLYRRGLDLEFIRQFGIGLSPQSPGMFRKVMHSKGISDETLEAAGLMTGRSEGSRHYRDFFSDRITFPIRDPSGFVIGFSARKFKEETFGGKYVNTAETPLFKKSKVLFGLNYSRRRIAKERRALIVEGQIDALRLIQKGFNITVAGQGTAFGEGHVRELMQLGVNLVYLALDSDNAGQEAIAKIGHLFQKQGAEVRVIALPVGMDPDSFLRENTPEDFLKLIELSDDYLSFLVKHHARKLNIDSPAGKNELVQLLAKQIREWDHPVMVQESLRKLAHLTQVPEHMVGQIQEMTPNIYIKKSAVAGIENIDSDRILETDLLRWLILAKEKGKRYLASAQKYLKAEDLHSPVCRQIYSAYLNKVSNGVPCELLELIIEIESPEAQVVLSELTHKKVNAEKADLHFTETLQRILERNWMKKREEVKMRIQSGQCDDEEALALVKQFDEIRKNPPKVALE